MQPASLRKLAATAAAFCALAAAPAVAQTTSPGTDMSSSITCLRGKVPANDYAELDQNMSETGWDSRANVSLVADIGGLVLDVRNHLGTSVCEREANNSTTCALRIDRTVIDIYTIRVENFEGTVTGNYRICAY